MPIYEYRCTACGHEIEVMQKMSARPLRKCSKCAGRLEKLVSRAAFQLRGGGWYSEGYAKDGGKKAAPAESSKKAKSDDSPTDGSPRKTTAS